MGLLRAGARTAAGLALTALVAACQDPSYGGPEYDVRAASDMPWSGAQLDFISDGFQGPRTPRFEIDGAELPATRSDDTTFTVSLPDLPTQSVVVDVVFDDDTAIVGPLRLHGFRDSRSGPALKGFPHLWPGGGLTSILVADEVGLVRYDVTHNAIAQRWPDSLHWSGCNFSPGSSFRSNHFVLQPPGCGWLTSWRVTGEPAVSDSAPWRCCGWGIVEMSPGRWLITEDDQFFVRECSGGACTLREQFGYSTSDAVLSPRGDRVALGGYFPFGGGPWVLDTSTGDSAFTIPALKEAFAVAFSPDGDTLYEVGRTPSYDNLVVVLDPATGTIRDSATIPTADAPGYWPAAVASDPIADHLYVVGYPGGAPTLLVYRRSTLELLTAIRAPIAQDWWERFTDVAVLPAPLDGIVYVLSIPRIYDPPFRPIKVYRFDRSP
jgi:hypothetical protein